MIFQFPRPYDQLLAEDNITSAATAANNNNMQITPTATTAANDSDAATNGAAGGEGKVDKATDIIFQMQLLFAR